MAEREIKSGRGGDGLEGMQRTFRRQICHYEEDGLEGLNDKRLTQASLRRAPVDEVMRLGE